MKNLPFLSLTLLTALLLSHTSLAQNWWGNGISGEGPKVTQTLDLDVFRSLGLSIDAQVYLTQGRSQSVKIEAQQNIIDNLKRKVENGSWKIKFDKPVRNHDGVKIWITMPTLENLALSGSGSIMSESAFSDLGNLALAISGSGKIKFEADSKSINAAISGSGNIQLEGKTGDSSFTVSGSGDVVAFDLSTKKCSVTISGSGDVSVNVLEELQVTIAGSGDVYYKGKPKVRSKISGSGDVVAK